ARNGHWASGLESLMDTEGFLAAVFGWLHPIGDGPHPVVEQWAVYEPGPDIERIDQLAVEALEAPGLVCVHHEVVIALQQPAIKVDHAANKARRENTDAAVIQKIDACRLSFRIIKDRVIAKMRIAVDDAKTAEGKPPGGEHRLCQAIAHGKRIGLVLEQLAPGQPIQCEQATR